MATSDKVLVKVQADIADLKRKMREAGMSMDKTGRKGQQAGHKIDAGMRRAARGARALKAGILAAAAATAGFVAVLAKAGGTAIATERLLARIRSQVKGTGMAAGFSAKEIHQFAKEMDLATLGSKRGFLEASSVLLTFKSVQGDVFKDAIRRAQDLAEIYGGDAKSAVVQLGKVLEDPTRNLSALARSGTTFNDVQTATIKRLQKSNKLYEAQKLILKEVAAQTANAARGAAKTTAGAIDTMRFHMNEFFEAVGKKMLPGIRKAVGDLAEMFKDPKVVEAVAAFAEFMIDAFVLITKAIVATATALGNLIKAFGQFEFGATKSNFMSPAWRKQIVEMHRGIGFPTIGDAFQDPSKPGKIVATGARVRRPTGGGGSGGGKAKPAPLQNLKGAESMFPALAMMKEEAKLLDEAIKETIAKQKAAIAELTGVVAQGMTNAMDGVVDALFEGKSAVESLKIAVKDFAKEMVKTFLQMAVIRPLMGAIFGGGGGGFGPTLGQAFAGAGASATGRASGGNLRSNFPTLVGERGPEILAQGTKGKIYSNAQSRQMMGGGPTIYADLRGADPAAVSRLETLVRDIDGSLEQRAVGAVVTERMRGGRMAKAFGGL